VTTAPDGGWETNVPDLTATPIADLADVGDSLDGPTEILLRQVATPRINLGTGPPGRAD
jgi:hypothetical protein